MKVEQKKTFINHSGQSVVEYVLLLVVIVSLAYSVLNSNTFKEYWGEGGFLEILRGKMEFTYRHGSGGTVQQFDYKNPHQLYFNPVQNESRFFIPTDPYPKNK